MTIVKLLSCPCLSLLLFLLFGLTTIVSGCGAGDFDFSKSIPTSPVTTTDSDGKTYYVTFCTAVSPLSNCDTNPTFVNPTGCQTAAGTPNFSLGLLSTEKWSVSGGSLFVNYTGGSPTVVGNREFGILFQCPSDGQESLSFAGEWDRGKYSFIWKHHCACPGKCAAPSHGGSGGLSGGSIFLIIVLCLLVVYCVAGVLFMKFKREATGTELIPNKDFWFSIPGLVKDGGLFLWCKITGREMAQYREV